MVVLGFLGPVVGLLVLIVAIVRMLRMKRRPAGSARLQEVGGFVADGLHAFLQRQTLGAAILAGLAAAAVGAANGLTHHGPWWVAVAVVVGAVFGIGAARDGAPGAVRSGVRAAHAAESGLGKAFGTAWAGGAAAGTLLASLLLLGVGILYIVFKKKIGLEGVGPNAGLGAVLASMSGFALGASAVALAFRVNGAIQASAARAGAERVAKEEPSIPADDVRNPASIAKLVGGLAGGVAGTAADLFESLAVVVVAGMVLGAAWSVPVSHANPDFQYNLMLLPLMLAGTGAVASVIGSFLARAGDDGSPRTASIVGVAAADVLTLAASWLIIQRLLPTAVASDEGVVIDANRLFAAAACGIGAALLFGLVAPSLAGARVAGAPRAFGVPAVVAVALAAGAGILGRSFAGSYGVALAATGLLSTAAIRHAAGAFGPIAGSAAGLAGLGGLGEAALGRAGKLHDDGCAVAAAGRAFAIGAAGLAAFALFEAFWAWIGRPETCCGGAWIGGAVGGIAIAILFAGSAASAVAKGAESLLGEARRQWKEVAGLAEGKEGAKADAARCASVVAGSTFGCTLLYAVVALAVPVAVGLTNLHALAGLIPGVAVGGVLVGIWAGFANTDAARAAAAAGTTVAKIAGVVALAVVPLLLAFHAA